MKIFCKYFKKLMNNIECAHLSANKENCKYCPDCGKKIVHRWILIKCRLCGHFRKPHIDRFKKIKPVKKYCFFCGSNKWGFQYYYDKFIPEKMKLISLRKSQTEELFQHKFGTFTQNTKVWVSNTNSQPMK